MLEIWQMILFAVSFQGMQTNSIVGYSLPLYSLVEYSEYIVYSFTLEPLNCTGIVRFWLLLKLHFLTQSLTYWVSSGLVVTQFARYLASNVLLFGYSRVPLTSTPPG